MSVSVAIAHRPLKRGNHREFHKSINVLPSPASVGLRARVYSRFRPSLGSVMFRALFRALLQQQDAVILVRRFSAQKQPCEGIVKDLIAKTKYQEAEDLLQKQDPRVDQVPFLTGVTMLLKHSQFERSGNLLRTMWKNDVSVPQHVMVTTLRRLAASPRLCDAPLVDQIVSKIQPGDPTSTARVLGTPVFVPICLSWPYRIFCFCFVQVLRFGFLLAFAVIRAHCNRIMRLKRKACGLTLRCTMRC